MMWLHKLKWWFYIHILNRYPPEKPPHMSNHDWEHGNHEDPRITCKTESDRHCDMCCSNYQRVAVIDVDVYGETNTVSICILCLEKIREELSCAHDLQTLD